MKEKTMEIREPGRGCTLALLTFIVLACVTIISVRGCGECSTCSPGGSCAVRLPADTSIDTSDFVDIYLKNNIDLVKWAQMAYDDHWGYVYGTWGNVLTDDLLKTKCAQYRTDVGENRDYIRTRWMGRRVADCVGLIKGYGWYTPPSGFVYGANGMPDIGANKMYETAAEKGEISTIPEIPGLAVWTEGHIGVYVGDGRVIEAMSTVDGVQKTRIDLRPWTHWLRIPYIEYIEYSEVSLSEADG